MDQNTADLLVKWGLLDYVSTFSASRVDTDVLLSISNDDISELIQNIGDRTRFKTNLYEWRAMIRATDENQSMPAQCPQAPCTPTVSLIKNTSDYASDLDRIILQELDTGSTSALSEEDIRKNSRLYTLLKTCNDGKSILIQYEIHGRLEPQARNRLCNLIIKHELEKDPNKVIPGSHLLRWAHEIAEIFTTESPSVYYTPYVSYGFGLRRLASGKLQDCYNNRKRDYRKSGLAQSSRRSSLSATPPNSPKALQSSYQNDDDIAFKDEWLKTSSDPWDTVETYWKATSDIRVKAIYGHKGQDTTTVYDYFNKYPCLKKPQGYELLIQDFNHLYEGRETSFFDNIPKYREEILNLAEKKAGLTRENGIKTDIAVYTSAAKKDGDTASIAALLLIPHLISSSTSRKRGKEVWKPSKVEVREGFVAHLKSYAELEEAISTRKEKLSTYGLSFQPLVLFVGKDITDIDTAYVAIDNVIYKIDSLLKAIDVAYKIIHATGAEYPTESCALWHVIQKIMYNMDTQWDKSYSTVNVLLAELGFNKN